MDNDDVLTASEFSKLTTALFSAATGEIGWDRFLYNLSIQAGDIKTHMFGYDTESEMTLGMEFFGYDPAFIQSYTDHYGEINAWAPGFAKQDVGKVIDSEVMCSSESLVKTEFYNDWVLPQENVVLGGGAILFKSDTRTFMIGGNIRYRDGERLKSRWLRLVDHLVPHLQQAIEINRALSGATLEAAVAERAGLRENPGIVVLSETGRIVFANPVAQNMIAIGDPIGSDPCGNISVEAGQSGRRGIHEILKWRMRSAAASFSLRSSSIHSGVNYHLRFARFTPEAQIALPLDVTIGHLSKCILLIITKNNVVTDRVFVLQSQYGLTHAEAEVACALADGLTSKEISDQRSVSIHTVRHQIKSAMAKLEVRRQTELVLTVQRNTLL